VHWSVTDKGGDIITYWRVKPADYDRLFTPPAIEPAPETQDA
jgi:hypothetical protein